MTGRVLAFGYGLVAYLAFFATILYAIGFVGNFVVSKSVDVGPDSPVSQAIWINVLLILLFGAQHTVMARPAFKAQWTRLVPKPIERSTFVLIASALLALIFWQWRPIPSVVWNLEGPLARTILTALFLTGWVMVFYSSFLIDHFDLFGLRQAFLYLIGKPYTHRPFKTASLYKWIRHPLLMGFLIAFWATPTMTWGHLLFAAVMTAYTLFGIALEERDLRRHLGDDYERYRRETPMILPMPWKRSTGRTHGAEPNMSGTKAGSSET
jgi:protein-S-isoprenylcysteine O-methyltransferase Ste14